ncbi:unnamed protein product [Agarophyton chilense]
MAVRLSRIVLLLRDVQLGLQFYRDGLGLLVEAQGANFARLRVSNDTALELCAAESESQCSTGYSPFLTFQVQDMDKTVPQLIQYGAVLDGTIRYEAYGKIAAVRSPDGHMVGLFESAGLPDNGDTALAASSAARRHLEQHGPKT